MKASRISILSRIMLVAGAAALIMSLFVPLWRIELDAPQYPEGLALLIYPNNIAGDVEIINGLNHYIGMKELYAKDFFEFTILPYIISFYALLIVAAAIIGRRKFVNITFSAFVIFGIIAMIDFWRWEYNYGHELNPHAAIQVPGMAYQPPLIGFKQLLNFGAYSIPDTGGWLFINCGVLLAAVVFLEFRKARSFKKQAAGVAFLLVMLSLNSCGTSGNPEPIVLNKDKCDYCKMTISDGRFGSELITSKGRIYKFDDVSCMKGYIAENNEISYKSFWVADFTEANSLLNTEKAFFVTAEILKSPMGGNTAAFSTKLKAESNATQTSGELTDWKTYLAK